MNTTVLLALISELYQRALAAEARVKELEQE